MIFNLDFEVRSRVLQVVVDPQEYIAEVYAYDKELLAKLTLGEGRQRFDAAEDDLPSRDSGALDIVQNRVMQLEQKGRHEAADGANVELYEALSKTLKDDANLIFSNTMSGEEQYRDDTANA